MSIEIKKQRLLKPTKSKGNQSSNKGSNKGNQTKGNQTKRSQTTKTTAANSGSTAQMRPNSRTSNKAQATQQITAKNPDKSKGYKRKLALFILVLLAVICPKPGLISYQKLGLVSKSIYLPNWFNSQQGQLLDSHHRVLLNQDLEVLYLCPGTEVKPDNCQRYQIINNSGIWSALVFYFQQQLKR